MKLTLKDRLKKIRKTHAYRLEKAKLEFVRGVTRVMRHKGISNAELARRMKTSPSYITKVMRGDENFTMESLVKITDAVGGTLHIHVADSCAEVRWLEAFGPSRIAEADDARNQVSPSRPKYFINPSRVLQEASGESRQLCA